MMPLFLNALLAFLWAAMSGSFTFSNLVLGYVLSFLVLFFFRDEVGARAYTGRVWAAGRLFWVFLRELLISNLRVAAEVVTPRHHMRPAIIAVPLEVDRDPELILIANMLTLTPGNLVLDVSEDRRTLYVHAMYASDIDALRRQIKEGFERAVLRMTRLR